MENNIHWFHSQEFDDSNKLYLFPSNLKYWEIRCLEPVEQFNEGDKSGIKIKTKFKRYWYMLKE